MGALAAVLRGSPADASTIVRRMLEVAAHRGTDLRIHAEGRCTVGIASASDGRDASVAAADGTAVAFAGRIDNFAELAAQSRHRDSPAMTAADLVLALFRELGDAAPNVLRGAFCGIVTDGTSMRAFRDHVGLAPLHHTTDGADVYVASEAGQVLAGSGIPRAPERDFFECLLYDRYDDETLTAINRVRRVPQGSMLSADSAGTRWARYWRPDELLETLELTSAEIQMRFDALMRQAVARTFTGRDVVALSGGIESTAIAAYAAPEYLLRWGRPLSALSAVYPAFPGIDERASIELVAKSLGLELHLFAPQPGPLDGLREWVERSGPAPSSFQPPRQLYLTARDLGFRTILNGNYGELATDVGQPELVRHLLRRRRIRGLSSLIGAERARGVSIATIARQLARAAVPAGIADASDRRRRRGHFGPDWLDAMRFPRGAPDQVPARGAWREAQLATFYVPRLQLEADELEQSSLGVQVRWPWLDVDLLEFFLGLPAETKYPDLRPRKLFVRRLLKGKVPDAILDRPDKVMFGLAEMRRLDYPFLRGLLRDPGERVAGVDYERLRAHLAAEDLPAREFRYIRSLAAIHLFLEEFSAVRT